MWNLLSADQDFVVSVTDDSDLNSTSITPSWYAGCVDKSFLSNYMKRENTVIINVIQNWQKTSFPLRRKISDLWKGQQY